MKNQNQHSLTFRNSHSLWFKIPPRRRGRNAFHREVHWRKLWGSALVGCNVTHFFKIRLLSKKGLVSYFCTFSTFQLIMLSRILGLGHLWVFADHTHFIVFKDILHQSHLSLCSAMHNMNEVTFASPFSQDFK